MKKRKLRCWVKIVIFVIGIIVGIFLAKDFIKQQEIEKQAIRYCIEKGRSERKCIENLYGN